MRDRFDYRPDLDGLRAIAVVPVILFHLGFAWTPGGFVGVDVFFVLSGYLITRQIALSLRDGSFSLLEFYDRRIRRLFPAFVAMLLASTVAALLVLLPDDLAAFGEALLPVSLSVSNFHFWGESGYFAPAAETMPLLHTWSLAVEEQFYLLFPLLLMLIWRCGRAHPIRYICILAVLSFATSMWSSVAAPEAAFYLLPSRAWELLLGSILALSLPTAPAPRPLWLRNAAVLSGLAGIGAAIFTYHAGMTFPGLAAALPCLGCALVIWAGASAESSLSNDAQMHPLALRFLTLPPLVFLGLISYSLYLWHWPIIVFTRYLMPDPLAIEQAAVIVSATIGIASASWKFIEQPLRRGDRIWPTPQRRMSYSVASVVALALMGVVLHATKGLPWIQKPEVRAITAAAADKSPVREHCHFDRGEQGRRPLADTCVFGSTYGRRIIVLGDSHGAELSYALSEVAATSGLHVRQVTASACPPAQDFSDTASRSCPRHMKLMMQGLVEAPRSTVIIAAHYFAWAAVKGSARDSIWIGLEAVVARLRGAGHDVVLLGDWPPHAQGRLPHVLAREVRLGRSAQGYSFSIDQSLADSIDERLRAVAERHSAIYIPLLEAVCGGKTHCQAYADGHAIYFDDDHLTVASARRIVRNLILPLLELRGNAIAPGLPGTARSRCQSPGSLGQHCDL
ncbi:MAG: acyltransferase family protein [Hyphomicrobiaceae bacterium]